MEVMVVMMVVAMVVVMVVAMVVVMVVAMVVVMAMMVVMVVMVMWSGGTTTSHFEKELRVELSLVDIKGR